MHVLAHVCQLAHLPCRPLRAHLLDSFSANVLHIIKSHTHPSGAFRSAVTPRQAVFSKKSGRVQQIYLNPCTLAGYRRIFLTVHMWLPHFQNRRGYIYQKELPIGPTSIHNSTILCQIISQQLRLSHFSLLDGLAHGAGAVLTNAEQLRRRRPVQT